MDYEKFKKEYDSFEEWERMNTDNVISFDIPVRQEEDRVNHPSHYTSGGQEVIDTIEDAIDSAPSMRAGFLQGQVLKYLLRLWLKDNPLEDARKAQWYLTRLIEKLSDH